MPSESVNALTRYVVEDLCSYYDDVENITDDETQEEFAENMKIMDKLKEWVSDFEFGFNIDGECLKKAIMESLDWDFIMNEFQGHVANSL
jgi:hypothetical protein